MLEAIEGRAALGAQLARSCFNGADEVVKEALEGAGAAKMRLKWEAARKQLLLAIEGVAIVGRQSVGGWAVGDWYRASRSTPEQSVSPACDGQAESSAEVLRREQRATQQPDSQQPPPRQTQLAASPRSQHRLRRRQCIYTPNLDHLPGWRVVSVLLVISIRLNSTTVMVHLPSLRNAFAT